VAKLVQAPDVAVRRDPNKLGFKLSPSLVRKPDLDISPTSHTTARDRG